MVPFKWSDRHPAALIHVGVHGKTEQILLETTAANFGYEKEDVEGKCRENGKRVDD